MFKHSVLVFLILAANLSSAQSNAEPKQPKSPLGLSVQIEPSVYHLSDVMKMETRLLNISNEDIYIWSWDLCWNPARGLSMYVTSSDGKPAHGNFFFDCVPPPPKEGDVYQFIRLQPGNFHGMVEEIKVTDIVSKPGEYDIAVTFSSFLSEHFIKEFLANDPIAKLSVWTIEKPMIEATRVHITVKP